MRHIVDDVGISITVSKEQLSFLRELEEDVVVTLHDSCNTLHDTGCLLCGSVGRIDRGENNHGYPLKHSKDCPTHLINTIIRKYEETYESN